MKVRLISGRRSALLLLLWLAPTLASAATSKTAPRTPSIAEAVRGTKTSPDEAAAWLSDPVYFANAMVRAGLADGCVSGAAHTTADTLRAALKVLRPAPGVGVVSSFFLMALREPTGLVSVMLANNETGVVQNVAAAGELARRAGAWMHTDAVQALGKITKNLAEDTMGLLGSNASDYYQQGLQKAQSLEKSIEKTIRENPLQSMAVAAGVGLLLGMLWRRR